MKGFTILAALLTVVAATNPLAARAECACDTSKCPTSGPAVRSPLSEHLTQPANPATELRLRHRPPRLMLRQADQRWN
jgi:hypothetical protein